MHPRCMVQAMNDVLVVGVLSNITRRTASVRTRLRRCAEGEGHQRVREYDESAGRADARSGDRVRQEGQHQYVAPARLAAQSGEELVPDRCIRTSCMTATGAATDSMTGESYVDTTTTFVLTTSIFDAGLKRSVGWAAAEPSR